MKTIYLVVPFAPLLGAILSGVFGQLIGRTGAHLITIAAVALSFIGSVMVLFDVLAGNVFNGTLYHWARVGGIDFEIGFLIDTLTATMMCVVTSVSLMVHIYTIGYMREDPGYQRFFAYISLFTFAMLMLVMSNNFLQLFFGWEAVGLVSYLLIGFWYTRPTATYANLKAFLVNRVGDLGFLLGIGLVLAYFGSLDYQSVFEKAPELADQSIVLLGSTEWSLLTVTCICLFIGAMGKSAQFPLHVWLPDSMEGPTPISALIHAATMVTAGIFMVARMSPLFELSETALSVVLVIGAITALFMGLLGIVQNDIKRVVAYSTLSQLGYMTVALGASAYSVAIFHLMTHAFFKALLFLAAGSVIMGMHHDQDIRNMGGLRKYMPITWITSLLGTLALVGTPFFSGFYSKDAIIESVRHTHIAGAGFAYFAVLAGVFITAFYSFRMYFLVFHGRERFDDHAGTPHESPGVVTLPLVLLAIPSVVIGLFIIEPMLFGNFFEAVIHVHPEHAGLATFGESFTGWLGMAMHGFVTLPFWLAAAGAATAAYFYLVNPAIPAALQSRWSALHRLLENKYYLDRFNDWFFAGGARALGRGFWKAGDQAIIDGALVNGSARLVGWFAGILRFVQSGFVYHYAIAMIVGVAALVWWFVPLLQR